MLPPHEIPSRLRSTAREYATVSIVNATVAICGASHGQPAKMAEIRHSALRSGHNLSITNRWRNA